MPVCLCARAMSAVQLLKAWDGSGDGCPVPGGSQRGSCNRPQGSHDLSHRAISVAFCLSGQGCSLTLWACSYVQGLVQ